MIEFTCTMEVFHDDKLGYMSVEFRGGSLALPEQDDMEDRQYIINQVQKIYKDQFEVLDLVGITQEGEIIWNDRMKE